MNRNKNQFHLNSDQMRHDPGSFVGFSTRTHSEIIEGWAWKTKLLDWVARWPLYWLVKHFRPEILPDYLKCLGIRSKIEPTDKTL